MSGRSRLNIWWSVLVRKIKGNWSILLLLCALAAAAGLKVFLVTGQAFPFNSDEAIVALMARHILQGERPVFFYGQAYMGSLDAWLVAGAFLLFGEKVMAVRFIQILLYLGYLLTLWGIGRRFFVDPLVASLAVLIAAIPTVMVTTYTTISLGGYGEVLVLGNILLWLGYEIVFGKWSRNVLAWFIIGLMGGLAFWTLGMAGIYLIPLAIVGLLKHRLTPLKVYFISAFGFFLGSCPWWVANFIQQGASLEVLLKSSLPPSTFLTNLTVFLFFGIPVLMGFRPPSSPEYLPWPLLLLGFILYGGVIAYFVWSSRKGKGIASPGVTQLLLVFMACFVVIIIGSNYGIDLTGRYYLPLYLPMVLGMAVLVAASWRKKPILGAVLLAVVLLINGYSTWRIAASEAKFTDQFTSITMFGNQHDAELISFLENHQERRGYTNYWISFRLAFLSHEELIYLAKLPYKSDLYYNPANNRYPAYEEIVSSSDRVAYITSRHPVLDDLIRSRLDGLGVSFSEAQIGDFHVFYSLSRVVRPEEIGLGFEYPR